MSTAQEIIQVIDKHERLQKAWNKEATKAIQEWKEKNPDGDFMKGFEFPKGVGDQQSEMKAEGQKALRDTTLALEITGQEAEDLYTCLMEMTIRKNNKGNGLASKSLRTVSPQDIYKKYDVKRSQAFKDRYADIMGIPRQGSCGNSIEEFNKEIETWRKINTPLFYKAIPYKEGLIREIERMFQYPEYLPVALTLTCNKEELPLLLSARIEEVKAVASFRLRRNI